MDLKKIITPLYWRAVPTDAVPPGIADRNYVFFDAYERSGLRDLPALEQSLEKLELALKIADILWVREHSKWVSRAAEWDQSNPSRSETRLLSPGDAAAVEAWARLKPASAPDIPLMLAEYVRDSIEKSERDLIRLRRTAGRAFVKPAEQALDQGWPDCAIRLAAAGAIVADDIDFALVPELWPVFARATIQNRLIVKLDGHDRAISDAVFNPNGNLVGTVSYDKTSRIWNARTGSELLRFDGHTDDVHSIVFSPDGSRIATTSSDDKVLIGDTKAGQNIYSVGGISVAFSNDGKLIANADRFGEAMVWNGLTGQTVARLKGHEKLINSIYFNTTGDRVITASYDHTARVWDVTSGNEITRLTVNGAYLTEALFNQDGALAATCASSDNIPRIWELPSGTEVVHLEGHEDLVTCISFGPDGKQLVSGSDDKTARVWDCKLGAEVIYSRDTRAVSEEYHLVRTAAELQRPPGTIPRGSGTLPRA